MSHRLFVWTLLLAAICVSVWSDAIVAADTCRNAHGAELRDKIRDCLGYHYRQPLDAARHSPWELIHEALAYGVDAEVLVSGNRRNAIGWLCWNGSCGGQRLFGLDRGALKAYQGAGLQGHQGQFLAMLAQCRVRRENALKVNGREFTVTDLIEYEQSGCTSGTDLSFKLIGLAYYLDSDSTWESHDGGSWSISRLIKEELAQPIVQGAACGGTHRLMGLSYAVRKRSEEGLPFVGSWRSAQTYIREFHEYAFEFQNPDGSFSTEWFHARGATESVSRRVQTTGHILEWLIFSLPREELTQARVARSVEYLADMLLDNPPEETEIGPKGHALRALALYEERALGNMPGPGKPRRMLARGNYGSEANR